MRNQCQRCNNVIRGFGLLCPLCLCVVHSDCYDQASINSMDDLALLGWGEVDVEIMLVPSVWRMLAPLEVVHTDMVFRFGTKVPHVWKRFT